MTPTRSDSWSTDEATVAEVDRRCDLFEEAWRTGKSPTVAEYVAAADAAVRPQLAVELDLLAAELRRKSAASGSEGRSARGDSHESLLQSLARCSSFAHLSPVSLAALASRLVRRTAVAGEAILEQGRACPGLQILLRGRLVIELEDSDGRRVRIDEALPGSVVGEIGLLTGQPCTAHVRVAEDSALLVLAATDFADLRRTFPELELALTQVVDDRLGEREFDGLCGKTIGPFQLVRCLGRGGMGVVYEARRIVGGEEVAVKMLRHGLADDPRAVDRFQQEAVVLAAMRHPGIVGVADLFVEFRTMFLVMELCRGTDLRQAMVSRGPLCPAIVRRVLGQIAAGLAHAHRQSVVHLDVKPSNVLIDTAGTVKLADFGLARMFADDNGATGLMGTPRYMPPEQLAGCAAGVASDWYAFGCLAAELLTATPMFDDTDLIALAVSKTCWRMPDEWEWARADPELAALVAAAMHPLPEHRQLDLDAVATWAGPVPELASRDRPTAVEHPEGHYQV